MHVLLINTDHWPGYLLGCGGHPLIRTPSLDAMARSGVRYTRCYSTCPVCIPARRSLMTGLSPATHGDRVYSDHMPMPPVPTLAGVLAAGGYQTVAVGKLHVYPQRNRIGFHEVILSEEGRNLGVGLDDYELWLADQGFAGQAYAHGMSNNQYYVRPWHLPEQAHPTNWATREAVRQIRRRDPTRPLFLYVSYVHPHPPLVPLQTYLDGYRAIPDEPVIADDWQADGVAAIDVLQRDTAGPQALYDGQDRKLAVQAFYALCTHIDHQIRLLLGSLREENMLDDTLILFTSDHGDMLFQHDMLGKRVFYEQAASVPLLISGTPVNALAGRCDDRLACLEDIMPTILKRCGLAVPDSVEGLDLLGSQRRGKLFGEISEGLAATRMATDGRYKLIYYPSGNHVQLFDLAEDPGEHRNLADVPAYSSILRQLTDFLIANLHGGDEVFVSDGRLAGQAATQPGKRQDIQLGGQRGYRWPPPTSQPS